VQIVKAVVMHEAALKAQAKKMNVDSLRSNADDGKESAEIRIAKVRAPYFTIFLIFEQIPHICRTAPQEF